MWVTIPVKKAPLATEGGIGSQAGFVVNLGIFVQFSHKYHMPALTPNLG